MLLSTTRRAGRAGGKQVGNEKRRREERRTINDLHCKSLRCSCAFGERVRCEPTQFINYAKKAKSCWVGDVHLERKETASECTSKHFVLHSLWVPRVASAHLAYSMWSHIVGHRSTGLAECRTVRIWPNVERMWSTRAVRERFLRHHGRLIFFGWQWTCFRLKLSDGERPMYVHFKKMINELSG